MYPSIETKNGCSTIGTTFASYTTSFTPGLLQTIGLDRKTYSFNFADLPCPPPPPDIGWDPARGPYRPQLAPPDFLFHLDPAFKTCIPGPSQVIHHYNPIPTARRGSPAGGHGHPHHPPFEEPRRGHHKHPLGNFSEPKSASQQALPLPWAPRKTAEPTR